MDSVAIDTWARRVRDALPQGRTLPEDVWCRRHRALLLLLWAHALGLTAFAVARGYPLLHSLEEGALIAGIAGLATLAQRRQRIAAALVSLGLISCSAMLVHLWGGVIEAHFHFFVMIALLSLYEDWVPFLLAAAYVVIHHGLTGALDPGSVYNHRAAIDHPWKWAGIHGFFVVGAGAAAVAKWRLNEEVRAETREAYRQARDSEERFRSAFANAPIGMTLASVDPESFGRFVQVNRAMCELVGRSEEELVGRSFRDITHPADVDETATLAEQLVAGETEAFHTEKRYVRSDGQLVWGSLNVSVVRDSSGAALYAIGQVQDITAEKRAREQLAFEAHHDSLTGLPNRRKLMDDLERELAGATREEPLQLLLFDLDGFKAYNDTFGHPAGDALLSILGHRLQSAVRGRGTAYRMGGDEFCVLTPLGGDHDVDVVSIASTALRERGEGFTVAATHGSVVLPTEAADPAEALRLADHRLYARKGAGRASPGRQATDALLSALSERSSDLGIHLHDVTDLCAAVAEELQLPQEQLTPLLQAAALHDVGKLGVPDAILNKPGPLGDEEWSFMRRHTLIGERILSAAPALSQAAKIVRWTHERFDGGGYPDGLSGDEIPLESRIVAVCDAFDAMVSDRPYRTAMSAEVAASELRRNAGTQFDPRVVEAFVASCVAARGTREPVTSTDTRPEREDL